METRGLLEIVLFRLVVPKNWPQNQRHQHQLLGSLFEVQIPYPRLRGSETLGMGPSNLEFTFQLFSKHAKAESCPVQAPQASPSTRSPGCLVKMQVVIQQVCGGT